MDWTLNLTSIIHILTLVGAIAAVIIAINRRDTLMGERLLQLSGRMINVENELKEINKVIGILAVQDQRLNDLGRHVDKIDVDHSRRIDNLEKELTRRQDRMVERMDRIQEDMREIRSEPQKN